MDTKESSNELLRIAKCGRAVGLKGELLLWPISNIESRYQPGCEYELENGKTLKIEKIRSQKDHFVVGFEGISSRTQAESLTNEVLLAASLEEDVLDEGEFFLHDCLGKNIVDQNKVTRGKAVSYIENAASDLLETESGSLIPFKFIESVDEKNIYINAPDGLFEFEEKDYS